MIAFQKSSQTVGGYSHEQVEVRNDEEKNDNKIKEKSKVKSESSESVLDDKLKDFLAVSYSLFASLMFFCKKN